MDSVAIRLRFDCDSSAESSKKVKNMKIFAMLFLILNLAFGVEMENFISVKGTKIPLIAEISNALPLGNISIIFYGGGKVYEGKAGLSAFSADLLNRGSKKKGEIDFANALESSAISLNVANGTQSLTFDISFLIEKQDEAFALLGELLNAPNFTRDAFNQSYIAMKSEILANENNFDYIASKNLNTLIFKDSPLGGALDSTNIDEISLSDVKDFVKNALSLENAVVLVGGALDLKRVKRDLEALLESLPKGKKVAIPRITPIQNPQSISVKKPTQQAFIYFASPFKFDSYEQDLHKMILMSFVMGGSGFGSRVMEEIRVKRGLAYSAYFSLNANNVTSYGSGYLQTSLANKDEAIKVLRAVISEFLRKGITEKELQSAKNYIIGSRVLGNETLNQRLNKKFQNFNRGLPLNYDDELVEKIKNTTLSEINAYIKAHSEVEKLSFSIVAD